MQPAARPVECATVKPLAAKILIVVGALAVILGAAYYWLIVESHVPMDAAYTLDINEIRRMAAEAPGEKPTSIEVEEVGSFRFPASAIVAGDGWEPRDLPVYSYRLVYPDRSVIIDTTLDRTLDDGNMVGFDPQAYARVGAAMSQASLIIVTHEHFDHIGGLMLHPDLAAILPAARLTREQLADPEKSLPAKFPEGALKDYQPLEYEKYHLIAPGVVLIKAPGHTPGSQMVYVQTADGKEVLFIGDVAWHFRNIEVLRERARLVTWLFLKEDRTAVFGQFAALKRLHGDQPGIHIVPGHDGQVIDRLIAAGVLKKGFM
jgi:glyoxylase-like metal-dependent hydrolase (beta-lactamase superfamily II)